MNLPSPTTICLGLGFVWGLVIMPLGSPEMNPAVAVLLSAPMWLLYGAGVGIGMLELWRKL